MEVKLKKSITLGLIKIKSTLNNMFVTLTDLEGKVIISKHAGLLAFKGKKKASSYVANVVFISLIEDIMKNEIVNVEACIMQVFTKTKRAKVKAMLRRLKPTEIDTIDYDDIILAQRIRNRAHNGVRFPKQRRI